MRLRLVLPTTKGLKEDADDPAAPNEEAGAAGLMDPGGERADFGDDVTREAEERSTACDAPPGAVYPFKVAAGYLEVAEETQPLPEPYTFMLLLSAFGVSAGPPGSKPTRLFEAIARMLPAGSLVALISMST